jgi:hypothetical protein
MSVAIQRREGSGAWGETSPEPEGYIEFEDCHTFSPWA